MRRTARNVVGIAAAIALVALALSAVVASPASAIGIGKWEAGTCKVGSCTYEGLSPANEFFNQAAGHPPDGVTDFSVNVSGEDQAKRVKVELPVGLNVNPQAAARCSVTDFEANRCPETSKVGASFVTSKV